MVHPRRSERDEAPTERPQRADAAEEENFEPEDDSDFGLDGDGQDEEKIGLDTDAGPDEILESLLETDDEDDASWLDDGSRPADIAADADDEDGADEDEGDAVAADSDTKMAEDWDDDFGFEDSAVDTDGGEEGLGDDGLLAGLELDALPPLDDSAAAEEEASLADDPLTADLIADLEAREGDDEDVLEEIAPGLTGRRLGSDCVRVELLQQSGQPLSGLVAAGDAGVAWDSEAVLVADAAAQAPRSRSAPVAPVSKLAAARPRASDSDDAVLIALATPAGVVCSGDGGRSFGAAVALPEAAGLGAALAFGRAHSGPRLWATPAVGPLYASDDAGASFRAVLPSARVLRIATDGAQGLLLLERDERGSASASRSIDGGQRFTPLELPVFEPERVQDLQLAGDVVLCCRRAPLPQLLLWSAREQTWSEVAGAAPPALLLDEAEAVRLYFWVGHARGARLVRVAPFAEILPELVAELPAEAGAPLQLAGGYRDGVTTLQVGTERAWYRLVVGPKDGAR